MRLALYQPDIAPNAGTLIRLGACLNVPVDIIEPCGFTFDNKALRRAGMDYIEAAQVTRHLSWPDFLAARDKSSRLVLLTTKAEDSYTGFRFEPGDILLAGRETKGAPEEVHAVADARLRIPMREGARSLNVALAVAMVLGEALRQIGEI